MGIYGHRIKKSPIKIAPAIKPPFCFSRYSSPLWSPPFGLLLHLFFFSFSFFPFSSLCFCPFFFFLFFLFPFFFSFFFLLIAQCIYGKPIGSDGDSAACAWVIPDGKILLSKNGSRVSQKSPNRNIFPYCHTFRKLSHNRMGFPWLLTQTFLYFFACLRVFFTPFRAAAP